MDPTPLGAPRAVPDRPSLAIAAPASLAPPPRRPEQDKQEKEAKAKAAAAQAGTAGPKQSPGEIRLAKDVSELTLAPTMSIDFPDGKDNLMRFRVTIKPDEGYYAGGKFVFDFTVPAVYPHELMLSTGFQSSRRMFRHTFPSWSRLGW